MVQRSVVGTEVTEFQSYGPAACWLEPQRHADTVSREVDPTSSWNGICLDNSRYNV
jgi:hypothetical protein